MRLAIYILLFFLLFSLWRGPGKGLMASQVSTEPTVQTVHVKREKRKRTEGEKEKKPQKAASILTN